MCALKNQKPYRRGLGRIKGLSKGLFRKVEGSQNWWKHSKKLARAHYRVACQSPPGPIGKRRQFF